MIDGDTCVSDRAKAQAGLGIGAVPGIPPQWHASSLDVDPPPRKIAAESFGRLLKSLGIVPLPLPDPTDTRKA